MHQVMYGKGDTKRTAFQLMMDVNRCLIMTSRVTHDRLVQDEKL